MRALPTLLLMTLVWSGCREAPQLARGQPVPVVALERLDGTSLAFPAATRGKVAALRFWADWCPYCEPEMRAIEPLYERYHEQGLVVLAVNVRQDKDTAKAFAARLGISYDVLLDESGEVARTYGVMGLPTTFFIDREGRLQHRILGESTPTVFEQVVEDLL
jgi:peroxiredoxin